jgi:hypothetical protein
MIKKKIIKLNKVATQPATKRTAMPTTLDTIVTFLKSEDATRNDILEIARKSKRFDPIYFAALRGTDDLDTLRKVVLKEFESPVFVSPDANVNHIEIVNNTTPSKKETPAPTVKTKKVAKTTSAAPVPAPAKKVVKTTLKSEKMKVAANNQKETTNTKTGNTVLNQIAKITSPEMTKASLEIVASFDPRFENVDFTQMR